MYVKPLNSTMEIGERIKEVLRASGHNARWLAEQIPCERTNVYSIFRRKNIDVELLHRLSVILGHDFFADMSKRLAEGNCGKEAMP